MSAAEQIPGQRRMRADSESTTEVRVAADATRLHVVRSVLASVAMHADLDLDAVDDLRLAVDEACSSLVRLAIPGTRLVARFQVVPYAIIAQITVIAAEDAVLRRDTFGWRVLTTLVTEVTAVARASEHRTGQLLEIEFVKVRREAMP